MLSCIGCQTKQEPIRLQGQVQGSYYSIIYYDNQHRNLQEPIDSLFHIFDQTASLWVENSLIRRVNRNETDTLSPMFADMLAKALEMNRYTNGCFDCRVGRLVQAWGFSFKKREDLQPSAIDSLMHIAQGEVRIDTAADGTLLLYKQYPETELDFNAIAQGYTVDLIAELFNHMGIENYLIDVGGEVIARGTKPEGRPWQVGIERPAEDKYDAPEVESVISLNNKSVVTSGSYRKYYEKDGARYSHTIDPSTGRPVEHNLLSASVVDDYAWRADALATALMVMGLEKAQAFAQQHPDDEALQTLFFIYDKEQSYETFSTPQFKQIISK